MKLRNRKLFLVPIALLACISYGFYYKTKGQEPEPLTTVNDHSGQPAEKAIFAGGCFWHMEEVFEEQAGVVSVYSGYTGGHTENPTYEEVGSGSTGHLESVEVHYNPDVISYDELLQIFWRNVDPTDANGQFGDRGDPYQSAIFYAGDLQKNAAEASKKELEASKRFDKPIVTKIAAATTFYKAEAEHQDYYKKSSFSYQVSEFLSSRDSFLDRTWGEDREAEISPKQAFNPDFNKEDRLRALTKIQYDVTQKGMDEPPFQNEYWDNKEEGIYVDVVSGEPLFSSKDKYDAGTGWPSFTQPIDPNNVELIKENGFFSARTVARSRIADSYLGDVFNDGPEPTGLRYCINSAALKFIPKDELEENGYSDYVKLFK